MCVVYTGSLISHGGSCLDHMLFSAILPLPDSLSPPPLTLLRSPSKHPQIPALPSAPGDPSHDILETPGVAPHCLPVTSPAPNTQCFFMQASVHGYDTKSFWSTKPTDNRNPEKNKAQQNAEKGWILFYSVCGSHSQGAAT